MKFTSTLYLFGIVFFTGIEAHASKSNLFEIFRNNHSNTDVTVAPVSSKPYSTNLEKTVNAKTLAKNLSKLMVKSAEVQKLIGNTNDIKERYGFWIDDKNVFYSNTKTAMAGTPLAKYSIISMIRTEKSDLIRVKVADNKSIQVLLSTDTGLGIPIDIAKSGKDEVVITPSYLLSDGNYYIKLRTLNHEEKLKLTVAQDESLGKN
jgi:hypothetical protein